MAEEDPERYIKRMRSQYHNKMQNAHLYDHVKGGRQQRMDDLHKGLNRAEEEYRRRKNAQQQQQEAARRAAAAAAGAGGSTSECDATYPHAGQQVTVAVDVLTPVVFALVVYVVMRLTNRTRAR